MSKKKRRVYIDIEADGLLDTVSRIWCIVVKDIDSGEIFKFHPKVSSACHTCHGTGTVTKYDDLGNSKGDYFCSSCYGSGVTYSGDHKEWEEEFKIFFEECDIFIGHNLIGYDNIVIKRILGLTIPLSKTIDTLVLSRLFRPTTPFEQIGSSDPTSPKYVDNRIGGHSLAAYGKRLGFPKQDFDDFSKFSMKQLAYCVNDVELGHRIWDILLTEWYGTNLPDQKDKSIVPFSEQSIRLEHKVAEIFTQQELDGFYMDQTAIDEMYGKAYNEVETMKTALQSYFPPARKFVREWQPKYNQDGSMNATSEKILTNWEHDLVDPTTNTYHLFEYKEFNPQSSAQVAERLESLGWKPTEFTPGGS